MPWVCVICGQQPADQRPEGPMGTGPPCSCTPRCKAKQNYACKWVQPPGRQPSATSSTVEEQAAALGFVMRIDTHGASFPDGHATNLMFTDAAGQRGIAPGISRRFGGKVGWEAYQASDEGWKYIGTFQPDLQAWPTRPNVGYKGGFGEG